MTAMRYLWSTMAEASVMLGSTSFSMLWESRAGLPMFSSYVWVDTPKAGGGFSIC